MKLRHIFSLILISIIAFIFQGCNKQNTGGNANAYNVLVNYLDSNGLDLPAIMEDHQSFLYDAPEEGNVSGKWVMDIRNASDFAAGHILQAHSVGYKDVLIAATGADKPILVVDYTGEVASYVVILLRLYGYEDAQALKWGMSGWNEQFDVWTLNCKNLVNENNWTSGSFETETYNFPDLVTDESDSTAILAERIKKVFAAGYKGIKPEDVLENSSGYSINFYMPENDYTGFGHVHGAFRVYPVNSMDLSNFNPVKKIVNCSYSGHTSAAVSAYLNVLGFDAWNLKYGLNGMTNSNSYWLDGNVPGHWGFDVKPKNLEVFGE